MLQGKPSQEQYVTEYKSQPGMVPRVSNLKTWREDDVSLDCKAKAEAGEGQQQTL